MRRTFAARRHLAAGSAALLMLLWLSGICGLPLPTGVDPRVNPSGHAAAQLLLFLLILPAAANLLVRGGKAVAAFKPDAAALLLLSAAASLADINAIKRQFAAPLARFADSLAHAGTVRDFTAAVFDYLTDCDIKNACTRPEIVRYFGVDRTADAIRLWNVTMDALDTLVDAAGDETVTAAEYSTLVELLFSGIDIAEIPTSMDQVMLGSTDNIRIDRSKYVIVLGVNEGTFPAPVAESPTLCESERRTLAAVGVELSQSLELRSARELYSFVRVLDFADTRVTVTYHTTAADGSAGGMADTASKRSSSSAILCASASFCIVINAHSRMTVSTKTVSVFNRSCSVMLFPP